MRALLLRRARRWARRRANGRHLERRDLLGVPPGRRGRKATRRERRRIDLPQKTLDLLRERMGQAAESIELLDEFFGRHSFEHTVLQEPR